jgi:hypothetical protein
VAIVRGGLAADNALMGLGGTAKMVNAALTARLD